MIKDTLYARYIKELEGLDIIENETGFISYKIVGKECFLAEAFTDQRCRRKGVYRGLLKELVAIATKNECEVITANIQLKHAHANKTLATAIACGFEVLTADNGILVIWKDLKGARS